MVAGALIFVFQRTHYSIQYSILFFALGKDLSF